MELPIQGDGNHAARQLWPPTPHLQCGHGGLCLQGGGLGGSAAALQFVRMRLAGRQPLPELRQLSNRLHHVAAHPEERWWSGPSHGFLSDHLECSLLISKTDVDLPD